MEKLTEPINAFKVTKSVKESIKKIADEEELLVHHVVRMLIRIGLKNYKSQLNNTENLTNENDKEVVHSSRERQYL
jgi:hypothetical protein